MRTNIVSQIHCPVKYAPPGANHRYGSSGGMGSKSFP